MEEMKTSSSSDLRIGIVYGSYRPQRKGVRAARFALKQLAKRAEVIFFDALEIDLPILSKMHKEYEEGKAPENLESTSQLLKSCDGYCFVVGEYNHGLQPGLKNFIDHFQKEYFFKPAGILSYSAGSFGGVRSGIHARVVLGELGMVTISTIQPIPKIGGALSEDGEPKDEKMIERFDRFSDELIWYASALKTARDEGTPY